MDAVRLVAPWGGVVRRVPRRQNASQPHWRALAPLPMAYKGKLDQTNLAKWAVKQLPFSLVAKITSEPNFKTFRAGLDTPKVLCSPFRLLPPCLPITLWPCFFLSFTLGSEVLRRCVPCRCVSSTMIPRCPLWSAP